MVPPQVVAVGDDDEGREAVEAPAEEADEIEGCVVGPLKILEHNHRARHLIEQHIEQRSTVAAVEGGAEPAVAHVGDVEERCQRSRRGQVVAPADHDTDRPGHLFTEHG